MSQWFIEQRQGFIADHLREFGTINRQDLMKKFDISKPQASQDLSRFSRENPGFMTYDGKAKTYVGNLDVATSALSPPQLKVVKGFGE